MDVNQHLGGIVVSRLGMNGNELQEKLGEIQRKAVAEKQHLIADHPDWNPKKDARITSLNNFITFVARTGLGVQFLSELLDNDWWQRSLAEPVPDETKVALTVSLEKTIKYSFGMDLFTGIETSFRILLRALDPAACKAATTSFNSIYDCLLGSKQLAFPSTDRQITTDLLNFVRLIRNLIHNSGVYFDEDGNDKEVNHKGSSYFFRHGKPVSFVTWELLLTLADDILQLLVRVVSHDKIVAVAEVTDPWGAAHGW